MGRLLQYRHLETPSPTLKDIQIPKVNHKDGDYIISTRGFVSTMDPGQINACDQLYYYMRHFEGPMNWTFHKVALRLAYRAFSPWDNWLKNQINSPYLYGRRLEFLEDTMRFIHTGRREVSINNWFDLLEDEPRAFYGTQDSLLRATGIEQKIAGNLNFKTSKVLGLWYEKSNGFMDMVCTLEILFGDSRLERSKLVTQTPRARV